MSQGDFFDSDDEEGDDDDGRPAAAAASAPQTSSMAAKRHDLKAMSLPQKVRIVFTQPHRRHCHCIVF